jgi:hypothetical protein
MPERDQSESVMTIGDLRLSRSIGQMSPRDSGAGDHTVPLPNRREPKPAATNEQKGIPVLKFFLSFSLMVAAAAFTFTGLARAQSSAPNLSGTYRCQAQPTPCKWQGQTPTISQSGAKLELHIDSNELAEGKLTSNITVSAGPPYNAEGLVRPDHSIEWSNGTKWVKQ